MRSWQHLPRFERIFLTRFPELSLDAYGPRTRILFCGFPTKLRAVPYGSYDEIRYFWRIYLFFFL